MNPTQEEFFDSALAQISSGLGDLCRGFKKIKTVTDQYIRLRDRKVPEVPKPVEFPTCHVCNYHADHRGDWNKHIKSEKHILRVQVEEKNGTKSSDSYQKFMAFEYNGRQPVEWLCDPTNEWNGWTHSLDYLYGKTLRGDRFKNTWLRDDTAPRGWRKINGEHLDRLYHKGRNFHEDGVGILEYVKTLSDFNSDYLFDRKHSIDEKKWSRVGYMQSEMLTRKKFRRWLIKVHSGLPALR